MTEQLEMPFLRINDITRINDEINRTMYATLQLIWDYDKLKCNLVERVHDMGGVDRTARMIDLNDAEILHCYAIGIYNR